MTKNIKAALGSNPFADLLPLDDWDEKPEPKPEKINRKSETWPREEIVDQIEDTQEEETEPPLWELVEATSPLALLDEAIHQVEEKVGDEGDLSSSNDASLPDFVVQAIPVIPNDEPVFPAEAVTNEYEKIEAEDGLDRPETHPTTALDMSPEEVAPPPEIQAEEPEDQTPQPDGLAAIVAQIDKRISEADTRALQEAVQADIGPASEIVQHIVIKLANVDYIIPISSVREVTTIDLITPVPNTSPWVTGVTNIRGDIFAIISARNFLNLHAFDEQDRERVLLIEHSEEEISAGLIVDDVQGIVHVPMDAVRSLGNTPVARQVQPFLQGVFDQAGRILVLLDIDKLLQTTARKQFEAA